MIGFFQAEIEAAYNRAITEARAAIRDLPMPEFAVVDARLAAMYIDGETDHPVQRGARIMDETEELRMLPGLSPAEERVVYLRRRGLTYEELGGIVGSPVHKARAVMRSAQRKIDARVRSQRERLFPSDYAAVALHDWSEIVR